MSSKFAQFLVFSCFMLTLLTGRVMTSPEVRQRRSDDTDPLEAVVQQLSQQVNSLNAEVAALKTKTAKLDKTVAFHAWNTNNPVRTTGHGTIILNHAATNIGNGYDPLTGVFTAPASGLYDFHVSIMTNAPSNKLYTEATIDVDGNVVAVVLSDSRGHGQYNPGSCSVIIHVHAGQKVYLKNTRGDDSEYYDTPTQPYTTFSGFLIEAD